MKVAVLMLSFERHDTLKRVLEHNLTNAGYPFDLFVWDNGSRDKRIPELIESHNPLRFYQVTENRGIAAPLNNMLAFAYAMGHDAFHVVANDILEPDNWLQDKIDYVQSIPNSGMISICPGGIPYPPQFMFGKALHVGDVIGQFMITREVYKAVGAFREDFGHYGPIDNDYNARCAAKGFVNYYIPGQSIHLGDDTPEYGYNKATAVHDTWPRHVENARRYQEDPTTAYIPPAEECTINMKQFVND